MENDLEEGEVLDSENEEEANKVSQYNCNRFFVIT